MKGLVLLDAWLLLGAAAQCALILKARRFQYKDWFLPLFILLGMSLAWFLFIALCSDWKSSADAFPVGFCLGVVGAAVCVAEAAPPQLNPTALLSLTITFWAAYAGGAFSRAWLIPGAVMTVGTFLFAAGIFRRLIPARFLLQGWALAAAAALAADNIPARVASAVWDYRKEELAPGLPPAEILLTGAQFFLFALLLGGLIMIFDPETWRAWYPTGRGDDERPGWIAAIVLVAQGAVLFWARRAGGAAQSQLLALATFAAVAHGAMTGADAAGVTPHPMADQYDRLVLTPGEEAFVDGARAAAVGFVKRRKVALALAFAAYAVLLYFGRS
jgi:hypothetical protein